MLLFTKFMIIKFSGMVDRRNINFHPSELSLGLRPRENSLGWKFMFLWSTIPENFLFPRLMEKCQQVNFSPISCNKAQFYARNGHFKNHVASFLSRFLDNNKKKLLEAKNLELWILVHQKSLEFEKTLTFYKI